MPWSYPDDLRRFRDLTMGGTLIQGRKTYESIGRPLPGRATIVVSKPHVFSFGDVPYVGPQLCVASLPDALDLARTWDRPPICVIGGAEIFRAALPLADELHLTLIGKHYEGDVTFPSGPYFANVVSEPVYHGDVRFACISREPCATNADLTFTKWVRR